MCAEVHGGEGLELVKPAREEAIQSPRSLKSPKKSSRNITLSPLLVNSRRKNTDRCQRLLFPSETSRSVHSTPLCMYVCVCVFIKWHITAQSRRVVCRDIPLHLMSVHPTLGYTPPPPPFLLCGVPPTLRRTLPHLHRGAPAPFCTAGYPSTPPLGRSSNFTSCHKVPRK